MDQDKFPTNMWRNCDTDDENSNVVSTTDVSPSPAEVGVCGFSKYSSGATHVVQQGRIINGQLARDNEFPWQVNDDVRNSEHN